MLREAWVSWLLRQSREAGHLIELITKLGINWDFFFQQVVADHICLTSAEHNPAQL